MVDQLWDFSDDRLIRGCIYCGGPGGTRDHVPPRVFLDSPFPENLPVVPACDSCNRGFSSDEEYVACLIEAAVVGTTAPDEMRRERVAKILRRQQWLRSRIEASRLEESGQLMFVPEEKRVKNVVLKLARGHAGFELSSVQRESPSFFASWPLHATEVDDLEEFEAPHVAHLLGEIGSRGSQRTMVVTADLLSENGNRLSMPILINDWVEVQEGRYRYLAYESEGKIGVKIVIGEYLACHVVWGC